MKTAPPLLRPVLHGVLVLGCCTSLLHAQRIQRWNGEDVDDNFGYDTTEAGDVDADGIEDLVIGAWHVDSASSAPDIQIGGVYVYSGATRQLVHHWRGSVYKDHFGNSVAGGGDANSDGYGDILVGARMWDAPASPSPLDASGRAFLYSGRTGQLIHYWDGLNAKDNFGQCVRFTGDLDADGFDEMLVSADGYDAGGSASGRVYVFSGRTRQVLRTHDGEAAGDRFGFALDGLPDVDMDGVKDYVVGAPLNHLGAPFGGRVYVYSGATGNVISQLQGASGDLMGWTVARAGDFDGDQAQDIVVGGIYGGGYLSGTAVCCDARSGLVHHTWIGENGNDRFGFQVAGGRDFNGDGLDDIVVGDAFTNGAAQMGGTAFVYAGGSGRLLARIRHEEDDAWTGHSVAMIADTNGDGFDEVLAGAPGGDYVDDGSVILAYGDDVILDASPRALRVGDRVEMTVHHDVPTSIAATFVVEANMLPMIILIHAGIIDAQGMTSFRGVTTAAMSGLSITMKSFVLTPTFELLDSNEAMIRIQ